MKVQSIEYELDKRRYVFTFEDRGIYWFRFLDKQTLDAPVEFKDWINSMIDEVKVRS